MKRLKKRTKVKARIVAHALEELMSECEKIIIMGHSNMDIDAMGSALGVYRIATSLKKEAYILANSESASIKSFTEGCQKNIKIYW
ncbi:MAG: DHH family phosphoesterase [Clostridia bacterium]